MFRLFSFVSNGNFQSAKCTSHVECVNDPTALSCVILAIYLSIRTAFRTFILQ